MIAPVVAFPVVLAAFKIAGAFLHRRSEMHFKHKSSELEMSIWTRLNHRLGACVGILNGAAYVILISFVLFNFSFWTVQVAASDSETATTRLINRLGKDIQATHLDKSAGAVGTLPDNYYKLANLAGLICQNPGLSARLAQYPLFVSLLERDDLQQLAADADFSGAWTGHAPMGEILNLPAVQNVLKNEDLLHTVWSIVEPNMDDLETYLKTGKSPKFDSQVILGRWEFDVPVTFAYLRLTQPKISSSEMRSARAWMTQAYAQTLLIVAGDNQAYLKFWPDLKAAPVVGKPPTTLNWKGQWSQDGANYQFTIGNGSDSKTFAATTTDGQRLMFKDDKNTYVFDHAD
jgi:hypothetical protein